jgi:hypothetical protein
MVTLKLVLAVIALLCFACAALGVATSRINLMAAGLFLWLASTLVGQ